MYISIKGIDLICKYEGFRSMLYNCPTGHATIGYGHKLHNGKIDGRTSEKLFINGLTKTEAKDLLHEDLKIYCYAVSKAIKCKLLQPQFDALVSLCYNIGCGAFARSTLVKRINSVEYWFKVWNKGSFRRVLPGLVNRRTAEFKMFSEGK